MDSVIMDILSDIHEPQRVTSIKNDDFVKSRKFPRIVIPVKTGSQRFQRVTKTLDTGFHRCGDFLRERQESPGRKSGCCLSSIGVMKQHLQKQKDHGLDVIPLLTGRFYLPVNIHSILIVFYSHTY